MGLPGLEGFPGIKVSTGIKNVVTDLKFKNVYWAPPIGPGTVLGLKIAKSTKQTKISAFKELIFQEEDTETTRINISKNVGEMLWKKEKIEQVKRAWEC